MFTSVSTSLRRMLWEAMGSRRMHSMNSRNCGDANTLAVFLGRINVVL
jgi:hypothetical protein